jgi:hypothetical protein
LAEEYTMPAPLPIPVRRQIEQLHQQGWAVPRIADHLGLALRTVRRLVGTIRSTPDRIAPDYRDDNRRGCCLDPDRQQWVRDLTSAHPGWGAQYLRIRLGEMDSATVWPSVRTLQRWMAEVRPSEDRATRRRDRDPRATQTHDTWQVDAVEQLALATGELVSWLRVTDEASGAFLHTRVFSLQPLPPRRSPGGAGGTDGLFRPLGMPAGRPRR